MTYFNDNDNNKDVWSTKNLYATTKAPDLATFKEALSNLSKRLCGYAFYKGEASDPYNIEIAKPKFADESNITSFRTSNDYPNYKNRLPKPAQTALNLIIAEISNKSWNISLEEDISTHHTALSDSIKKDYSTAEYNAPLYDLDILVTNLKVLWDNDLSLDPRIDLIKDMFSHQDNAPLLLEEHYDNHSRHHAAIAWASEKENANKIAQMFLYSRLSEHFEENTLAALELTQIIRNKYKAPKKPISAETKASFNTVALTSNDPRVLSKELPQIIKDYQILLNGNWTRELSLTKQEAKEQQIAASSTPYIPK